MGTTAEYADVRRRLKKTSDLPPDDGARDRAPGRGEPLNEDVPFVTPITRRPDQAADAADPHMSVGKMEMSSSAAVDNSGTLERKKTKRDWSKCNKNTKQNC